MNRHAIGITAKDVKVIPHIVSLNKLGELAKDMQNFCQTEGLTLALGNKSFAELISCKKPEHNPILIVVVANIHSHEKDKYKMPMHSTYAALLGGAALYTPVLYYTHESALK